MGIRGSQAARYGSAYGPASTPVTLQPVPLAQSATGRREVIASTFQPVQRVSAVQMVSGSYPQSGPPPLAAGNSGVIASNGPVMEDNAAPGNIVLPAPRPLGSAPSNAVFSSGAVPPMHAPYASVPREFEKMALPPYVVEPPDLLLIQASNRITLRLQPIQGQYLVTPDGTINLGIYGKVRVAGMTLDQVADAVAARLLEIMPGLLRGVPEVDSDGKLKKGTDLEKTWKDEGINSVELVKKEMQVDVLSYNSKYYYVITDGGGYGQQVYPFLVTGNETVLDALAKVNGLPAVANKQQDMGRPRHARRPTAEDPARGLDRRGPVRSKRHKLSDFSRRSCLCRFQSVDQGGYVPVQAVLADSAYLRCNTAGLQHGQLHQERPEQRPGRRPCPLVTVGSNGSEPRDYS